jgi:hypothetical protein
VGPRYPSKVHNCTTSIDLVKVSVTLTSRDMILL